MARYASARALLTMPTDYAKFVTAVLEPREGDPYRLNSRTVSEMLQPQIKADGSVAWALGWAIQHTPEGDFIFHSGSVEGAHCMTVASMPQTGVVVMTNGQNGYKVIEKLRMSAAMGQLLQATTEPR